MDKLRRDVIEGEDGLGAFDDGGRLDEGLNQLKRRGAIVNDVVRELANSVPLFRRQDTSDGTDTSEVSDELSDELKEKLKELLGDAIDNASLPSKRELSLVDKLKELLGGGKNDSDSSSPLPLGKRDPLTDLLKTLLQQDSDNDSEPSLSSLAPSKRDLQSELERVNRQTSGKEDTNEGVNLSDGFSGLEPKKRDPLTDLLKKLLQQDSDNDSEPSLSSLAPSKRQDQLTEPIENLAGNIPVVGDVLDGNNKNDSNSTDSSSSPISNLLPSKRELYQFYVPAFIADVKHVDGERHQNHHGYEHGKRQGEDAEQTAEDALDGSQLDEGLKNLKRQGGGLPVIGALQDLASGGGHKPEDPEFIDKEGLDKLRRLFEEEKPDPVGDVMDGLNGAVKELTGVVPGKDGTAEEFVSRRASDDEESIPNILETLNDATAEKQDSNSTDSTSDDSNDSSSNDSEEANILDDLTNTKALKNGVKDIVDMVPERR